MSAGISWMRMALLWFGWGGLFGSSAVTPLPEDPVVAQAAPEECLFYTSWTGKTQASPEAVSSTERLFSDPDFLAYIEQANQQVRETIYQTTVAQGIERQQVDLAFYLLEHLGSHAGAFFVSEIESNPDHSPHVLGGFLVRVDDDEIDRFSQSLEALLQPVPESLRSTVSIGDHPFFRIELKKPQLQLTWGIQDNYLIVGLGDGEAEKIIDRRNGSVPDWLIEAKEAVTVFRPSNFAHLDIQRLFSNISDLQNLSDDEFSGFVEAFGFDAMESFSYGSGLDDQGAVGRGQLKLSGELSGMLTLLDCEPLVADDFQEIDSASPAALVFQFNLADAVTVFLDCCDHEMAPGEASNTARSWRQQFEGVRTVLGVDVQNDLLPSMGDTWRLFAQPGPQALLKGWTLSVDLSDADKFAESYGEIISFTQRRSPITISEEEHGGTTLFSIASLPAIGLPIAPAWCIHEEQLFVSSSLASIKQIISGKAPEKTLAETDHVRPFLEEDERTIRFLNLDTAAVMELALPLLAQQLDALPAGLPIDSSLLPQLEVIKKHLRPMAFAAKRTEAGLEIIQHGTLPNADLIQAAPLLMAAVLPARQGARNAARRNQSLNQHKQILLAMHNFADVNGVFPAGYSADEEGNPLLSWRVHILPYLEEQALYNRFHLDEPWDSPHNKELVELMPDVYRSPRSQAEQGKTTCLGVGGGDGVFVKPQDGSNRGTGFRDITDGTAKTAMVVEVTDNRAITWTRPGDYAPQKANPRKDLHTDDQQRIRLGFADGSVRSLPEGISDETLMKFFTKSGGERIENH